MPVRDSHKVGSFLIILLISLPMTCRGIEPIGQQDLTHVCEEVPAPLTHAILSQSSSIQIDSNYDFVTLGFPGSGTFEDPYVIGNLWIDDSLGIHIENVMSHFKIANCTFWAGHGISIDNAHGFAILNNEFLQLGGFHGISIHGSSDFLVQNNRILPESSSFTSYEYGITIQQSRDGVVDQNTITNSGYGVELDGSNVTVSGNIISGFDGFSGINCVSDGNIVSGNQVTGYETGISTIGDDYVVSDNTCSENGIGIMLSNSGRNTITSNSFFDNELVGMQLIYDSSANIIRENRFEDNVGYGIEFFFLQPSGPSPVENPVSNQVFRNIFISNNIGGPQAYDQFGGNGFGYNYWSDWTAHEDEDNDGFLDEPYPIGGGVTADSYPLANESSAYSLAIDSVPVPNRFIPLLQQNSLLVSIFISWALILIVPNVKWYFDDRRENDLPT